MASQPNPQRDAESAAWDSVVLAPAVKAPLLEAWRAIAKTARPDGASVKPFNLLVYGAPGVGKTEISRAFSQIEGVRFFGLGSVDFKAGYVGQSEKTVQKLFVAARAAAPAVLRTDDLEYLWPAPGGSHAQGGDAFWSESRSAVLSELDAIQRDGVPVFFLAETFDQADVELGVFSRFSVRVEIPNPGFAERREILRRLIEKSSPGRALDVTEISALLADYLPNANGRDLDNFVRRALEHAVERAHLQGEISLAPRDLWAVLPGYLARRSDSRFTWDNLFLPDPLTRTLQILVKVFANRELLEKQGAIVPTSLLLTGPPGTGKSRIVKTLAHESGQRLIVASVADVESDPPDLAGSRLAALFERARNQAPCVLFFDDVERIASRRGGPGNQLWTTALINQFLAEIDTAQGRERNKNVFVAAATNRPDLVDASVICHIPQHLEIPNPGPAERAKLWKLFLAKKPRDDFDLDATADDLAARGEASGRDIESAVERAAQEALERALNAGDSARPEITREDLLRNFPRK